MTGKCILNLNNYSIFSLLCHCGELVFSDGPQYAMLLSKLELTYKFSVSGQKALLSQRPTLNCSVSSFFLYFIHSFCHYCIPTVCWTLFQVLKDTSKTIMILAFCSLQISGNTVLNKNNESLISVSSVKKRYLVLSDCIRRVLTQSGGLKKNFSEEIMIGQQRGERYFQKTLSTYYTEINFGENT